MHEDLVQQANAPSTIPRAIGSIVLDGCPEGHGGAGQTLDELNANPATQKFAGRLVSNYKKLLERPGMDEDTALELSVGTFALLDDEGSYIRREPESRPDAAAATNSRQTAGSEKK
jgi:hypothetical protein